MTPDGPVLVVAPHGLDEVLGCGGVIARHAAAGAAVHVAILFGDGSGRDAERRRAAQAAAARLGAAAPEFLGLPENRGDTLPILSVIGLIEGVVRRLAPASVYLPHVGNLNIDHQVTARAAATALRPAPGCAVRAVFAYEVPSSTDWAPAGFGPPFQPVRTVDIAAWLDAKLAALALYGSEVPPAPHARSVEAVRALAVARGASVGLGPAESFMVLREVVPA